MHIKTLIEDLKPVFIAEYQTTNWENCNKVNNAHPPPISIPEKTGMNFITVALGCKKADYIFWKQDYHVST